MDQLTPATTTIYIDTLAPAAPGPLSLTSRTGNSFTLAFGATTTETNFSEYKIFYKQTDGSDPTESDSILASSTDANLGDILFNSQATTSVDGLDPLATYSFAIWAYDRYGNRASSSRVDIATNDAPTGVFNSAAQNNDGSGVVAVSIEVADDNQQDCIAQIAYVPGSGCDFTSASSTTLNAASIIADLGSPEIDNGGEYQIGTPAHPIITPVANTVIFDWLGRTDEPAADGTYCLRLIVNDGLDDQLAPATTTLVLDNLAPTVPGNLIAGKVTTDYITLIYATSSPATDSHAPATNAYRIFYKQGTAGVTENDSEYDTIDLDAYGYNGATSSVVSGLDQDTWYVFNLWAYDAYGNKMSASETAVKTSATLANQSVVLMNGQTGGSDHNIVLADTATEWDFRVTVTETNGWYAIASTTLRLADQNDNSAPFRDLRFYWGQTENAFYEIGTDAENAVTLSPNSSADCNDTTCNLDFKLIFNKDFISSFFNYAAEVYSTNDFGVTDEDTYPSVYQVRFPYVRQIHYRWRNDDGGE